MTPKDFVNYFHGAIELAGLTELNHDNYVKTLNKLKEIKTDATKESVFCLYMLGVLESADNETLSSTQFQKVALKLEATLKSTKISQEKQSNSPGLGRC